MNLNAVDQIGRTRIDEAPDPYRAERLGGQRRADLQAAERVARTQPAHFARVQAARERPDGATASLNKADDACGDGPVRAVDWLCDVYATERLKSAIQAFLDQQAMLQARADAANDLGTIQGLLPLQPYRYAVGNPPILPQQLAAAASVAPAMVGPVANMAALRNTTDDALNTDPATRARGRRSREITA